MADTSSLIHVSGSATHDYQDTVQQVYRVIYDSIPTNHYQALIRAQTATGEPVPARRSQYLGTALARLFVHDITSPGHTAGNRSIWEWTVRYAPAPPGELHTFSFANPLDRPATFDIQYMDSEHVVHQARNVEQLPHGDGKGGNRPAGTLGPIVNAAGKRPDEPIVRTKRLEVLVIKKNFPSLAAIVQRNRAFKLTTNSDHVQGYGPRELAYQLTESLGVQFEAGVEFWPAVTTILADDTTDLILDNVGYEYWDAGEEDWARAKVGGEPTAEPVNLKLDGDEDGDYGSVVTFRDLNPVAYATLFN